MPSSGYSQIPKIIELVMLLRPQSVLDIGAGFGKYGLLCREYLELWDGRENYLGFKRRIDAVEAFPEYITPVHKFLYNNVYVDDIGNVVDKLGLKYDLVLLIDVLEHFEKEYGMRLLRKLVSKNGGIIISTPKRVYAQQDAFGNEFERHRSQWSSQELRSFGNIVFVRDRFNYICFIGKRDKVSLLKRKLLVKRVQQIPLGSLLLRGLVSARNMRRQPTK